VPSFKYSVEEDEEPMDLTGLVLEVNMWANAKLKSDITNLTTTIRLADNIGFEQILVDDIIIPTRVRSPEQWLVKGFDEINKTITVQRGYNGTTPSAWKRGTSLRIMRIVNGVGTTEMIYEDITQVDGTILEDQLVTSYLVYEWQPNDTCVPGCYWLEFKLIEPAVPPNPPPGEPNVCYPGVDVEWVRRYPVCGEFLIKICDTPTNG
jgi:hypothetical protein